MTTFFAIIFSIVSASNINVEWGTIDSTLTPRGRERVWVKITNTDSIERVVIPNQNLIPRWSLIADDDTTPLAGSGILGTFDDYIELRPHNGLFIFDLIDLFPLTEKYALTHKNFSLKLETRPNINYINPVHPFSISPIDNPAIEAYMQVWDSIRSVAKLRKGVSPSDAQNKCTRMQNAWNDLSNNNKLTGRLVASAFIIRINACGEGSIPIPYSITPAWKEFESATLCIADERIHGASRTEAVNKCRSKILDLHSFIQKLAQSTKVIPIAQGVKFVTQTDTLRLFPIYYWPVQQ